MSKRNLLMILLISFSVFLIAGCDDESKPNAFLCTYVHEESVLYCKNIRTKETKYVKIQDANKYVCASPDDYRDLVSWYKAQCNPGTHHPNGTVRNLYQVTTEDQHFVPSDIP